jgi:phospholipid transport system substrate-binding protein
MGRGAGDAARAWQRKAGTMSKRLRRFCVLTFLAAATIALLHGAPVRADSAVPLITRLNDALLGTMKSASALGYEGRYKKLDPVIRQTFDLSFMTQYSAGRHWRALSEAQKKSLVDAFSRLTVATYADRFDGYSGEKFVVVKEATPREGNRLVESELIKSDGEPIKLNYLLRQTQGGWRVIDIFLKGTISELATKRSEYSSALSNQGFDGLMAIFEQKISGLKATKS